MQVVVGSVRGVVGELGHDGKLNRPSRENKQVSLFSSKSGSGVPPLNPLDKRRGRRFYFS
jgi:hypothetical protein